MTGQAVGAGANATAVSFGIFDWIDIGRAELAERYEQRLKMLEYADEAGFYCYHVAEHHATPLGMAPSPNIFLAAAAQRTRRIRLGSLVYVLPLYNPVRLLQEIRMLDSLSRGRLDVGVGRGISPYELGFYNVDADESRAMFREALEIIVNGLATGVVSFEGRYYSFKDRDAFKDLRGMRLQLAPYQRPYPPLWYPTDNPESIKWLAQQGFSTVFHYPPMQVMREHFDLYKREWEEHRNDGQRLNGHVAQPKYGMTRHIYVAESDAQALREAKEAFADFITSFNYLRTLHGDTSGRTAFLADFEARMEEGLHIVGSPATVRARVKEQVELTGCNYFVGTFAFGTLTTEQTLSSMRLFAQQVMPAFAGPS